MTVLQELQQLFLVQMFYRVRDKNVISQEVTLLAGTEINT